MSNPKLARLRLVNITLVGSPLAPIAFCRAVAIFARVILQSSTAAKILKKTRVIMIQVNGRIYARPQRPTVIVCLDGCDPRYLNLPMLPKFFQTFPG